MPDDSQSMPDPSGLTLHLFPPTVAVLTWDPYPDMPDVEFHILRAEVAQTDMGGMPGPWSMPIAVLPLSTTSWATNFALIGGETTDAELYRLEVVNIVTGESHHQLAPYEQVGTHTDGQLG